MIKRIIPFFFALTVITAHAQQKVISLYNGAAPGSENWTWNEAENDHNAWNTEVVYNISHPTLAVFMPDSSVAPAKTAVIICPGGGFHGLSINSEGNDVARWLAAKGITCFVLRYRLAHSLTDDPVQEWMASFRKKEAQQNDSLIIPLSIADGRAAIAYVRQHASEFNVAPDRIGIIGFSAGGTVAASSAFNYTAENRPDFVAPIYPYMPEYLQGSVAADAPPMFLAAATDDQLGLNATTVDLYNKWIAAKHSAELHLYAKGGHGFGMRKQNISTDSWIDRFGDWLQLNGFAKSATWHSQQIADVQRTLKDWPNLHRYDAANKKLGVTANERRVVFMGNSITDGWINSDSAFFADNHYIDRGISGQTTPQMLLRFRQDVIDLHASAVVILAGINDIAQNTGPMTLEQTFGNIVSMAELARANNIKVVICSVLPAYDFPWRPGLAPAEKVVKLNEMLKAYAEKNHIVYVDYFSAMADERKGLPKSLSNDGIHPTLAGYKIMEPLVKKGIEEAMKRK